MNKRQVLSNKIKEVSLLTDRLGKPIDRGIKRAVALMQLHGIETTASCQGHKNWGLKHPWVQFKTDERVAKLLDECFRHQLDYLLEPPGSQEQRLTFNTKEALKVWNWFLFRVLDRQESLFEKSTK